MHLMHDYTSFRWSWFLYLTCAADGLKNTKPLAPEERGALTTLEATTGFEPVNGGFADLCLTTWLRRRKADSSILGQRCQSVASAAGSWYDTCK